MLITTKSNVPHTCWEEFCSSIWKILLPSHFAYSLFSWFKKKKILGISKKYKTGYLKIKIWVNFSEAFGKLRKRKTWDGFPFVGIAASSCWAGKWNRFVIVLAEQPSLISNWDLRDLHKYLTVSKEMLTKPPRWISKEFNNKKKNHTYRNSHLNLFKSVIHRCKQRLGGMVWTVCSRH